MCIFKPCDICSRVSPIRMDSFGHVIRTPRVYRGGCDFNASVELPFIRWTKDRAVLWTNKDNDGDILCHRIAGAFAMSKSNS